MNIPIIYEDDWLLVVNKPAGLLTVPTPRNESRTLTSILNQDAKERGLEFKLYPCHRLDRDTSGLIIYAKGPSIQKQMMDLFRQRLVSKKYIAFVHGKLAKTTGEISSAIEGKTALTKYKLLEQKKDYGLVEVVPVTGRTNQIRIHFKNIQHPLVGEDKFAFRRDFSLRFKRVCLESSELKFKHPQTGKEVVLKLPLDKDLQKFLETH